MPLQRVMTYKGSHSEFFKIDPGAMASAVRKQLNAAGFIGDDSKSEAWRFFIYNSKSTEFSDAILGKEVESLVPISGMFGPGEQLYLTNTHKETSPDLMGIGAEWFFDRYMSCRVKLNNEEESAREVNAGKFEPMLMTHVRPTSHNVAGIYDNVVVCEQGSVITFEISSWGAAGFRYSIKPEAGEKIVDALYNCFGDTPNRVACSSIRRYSGVAKQIVVNSTSSMQIPSGQTVQYQRVAVQTQRLTSYKKAGHTYTNNSRPPNSVRSAAGVPSMAQMRTGAEPEPISPRVLAQAEVLPGETITPGTTHPGDNSNQQFGRISDAKYDSEPLSEIVFYFFVFKTHDDAAKVIGSINAPNPDVWK